MEKKRQSFSRAGACRILQVDRTTASQEWSEALRRAAFERRPGLAVALERAMDHLHMYKMGFWIWLLTGVKHMILVTGVSK